MVLGLGLTCPCPDQLWHDNQTRRAPHRAQVRREWRSCRESVCQARPHRQGRGEDDAQIHLLGMAGGQRQATTIARRPVSRGVERSRTCPDLAQHQRDPRRSPWICSSWTDLVEVDPHSGGVPPTASPPTTCIACSSQQADHTEGEDRHVDRGQEPTPRDGLAHAVRRWSGYKAPACGLPRWPTPRRSWVPQRKPTTSKRSVGHRKVGAAYVYESNDATKDPGSHEPTSRPRRPRQLR